jgi:prophage DNA circulation protein
VADTVFEEFPVCTWEVTGYKVPIPVKKVDERGGNRIVRRTRQSRDGAKLDDTGSIEVTWTIEADFYNGCTEEGIPFTNLYPDVVHFLVKSFRVHETGTLSIPTVGRKRCRLESYQRTETFEEIDCAPVVMTFVEDNEDALIASTFTAPSARATARRLAEITTFSAQQNGVSLSDSRMGISELASEVETLINSPFEYLGDLQAQAESVKALTDRMLDIHASRRTQIGSMLAEPPGARAVRGLVELRDKASRIVDEKQSAMPRLVPYVVPSQRSIFDIAAQFGQDPMLLMTANPQIGDPLAIPERTVVKVFESAR